MDTSNCDSFTYSFRHTQAQALCVHSQRLLIIICLSWDNSLLVVTYSDRVGCNCHWMVSSLRCMTSVSQHTEHFASLIMCQIQMPHSSRQQHSIFTNFTAPFHDSFHYVPIWSNNIMKLSI